MSDLTESEANGLTSNSEVKLNGLIILILLMVSGLCQAQYSNHQLYQAYLTRDMDVWKQHIASTNWDSITDEEKKQLLNYEYGFTAYSLSRNMADAMDNLMQYEAHLQDMEGKMDEAERCAYMAGLYSYKLSVDQSKVLKYGQQIYQYVDQAIKLSPDNPLVLSMQGNIEFYGPFGSKRQALAAYRKSEATYQQMSEKPWNILAVQMTIVQCLDKMGKRTEAIEQCQQYLQQEPDCVIFQQLLEDMRK